MSQSRQLAAIMFTDIVGFTALMGSDEQKTFEILEKNRQIHKPIISTYNGRWIKELGDGVMASFGNVSDAVNAAIKIMQACNAANEYQLCIGIHLAEVVFENDDVFGDGVNIAARIQSAAAPGCIFISESVHRNVSNKTGIETRFAKEAILKNVSQPIRMYQVMVDGGNVFVPEMPAAAVIEKSIAVLPFVNMSDDRDQEYFSDGISEEIINMLAQVQELKVIGRTSSFAFKGKNMDLKVIGDQLKVSYILEGSVRKSGNKLRITAQLIKAADGFHLYSEKFDRELEDIFAIQDEVSLAILNAIKIKIFDAEKEAVLMRYTENVEAYQLYLQGRFHLNNFFTPDGLLKAIEYFDKAIVLEPEYAIAFANKAFCYMTMVDFNWIPPDKGKPEVRLAAMKSFELDDKIAESLLAVGRIKLHWEWKIEEAAAIYRKAIAINPNYAESHIQLGMCLSLLDRYEEALKEGEIAESLDPLSILNLWYASVMPYSAGDYKKLHAYGKKMVALAPNFFPGYMMLGTSHCHLKEYPEAIIAYEKMVQFAPGTYSLGYLGMTYGVLGDIQKARDVIEKMQDYLQYESDANHSLGNVYFSIGEWDKAFEYYEKSFERREGHLLWIKYFFRLIPESFKDPRVRNLLDRIGVPYE